MTYNMDRSPNFLSVNREGWFSSLIKCILYHFIFGVMKMSNIYNVAVVVAIIWNYADVSSSFTHEHYKYISNQPIGILRFTLEMLMFNILEQPKHTIWLCYRQFSPAGPDLEDEMTGFLRSNRKLSPERLDHWA